MLYADLFVGALNQMGYDALNLGERELFGGMDLVTRMKDMADFPLISSNVSSNDPLWKPYVIKEIDHVRVAILGILSPRFNLNNSAVSVEQPQVSLKGLMAHLNDKADIFVLLSHMGLKGTLDLIKEVPGVDIAIIGHMIKPLEGKRVGKTLVISPGNKGERVGVIHVAWDTQKKKIVKMDHNIYPLGDDIESDNDILELVREFNLKVDKLRAVEFKRKKKEQDAQVKALIERSKNMKPEEFIKFYREEMKKRQVVQQ